MHRVTRYLLDRQHQMRLHTLRPHNFGLLRNEIVVSKVAEFRLLASSADIGECHRVWGITQRMLLQFLYVETVAATSTSDERCNAAASHIGNCIDFLLLGHILLADWMVPAINKMLVGWRGRTSAHTMQRPVVFVTGEYLGARGNHERIAMDCFGTP